MAENKPENKERRMDDLLDSALSVYSAVDARPGLEARVLARVQEAAKPQARSWNVRWLLTGAVATAIAAIVLSVVFSGPVRKPQNEQVRRHIPSSNQLQTGNSHQTPVVENNRHAKRAPVVRKEMRPEYQREELARNDRPPVFPTPTGLSEQEKLLLSYLAQTPKEELIAEARIPDPAEEEEFWKDQQPAVVRPLR